MRTSRKQIFVAVVLWAALAAPLAAGPGGIPVLTPTVVYVPEQYHTGGAYTAIQAASDGRVYIGTTIYDGYGHLLSFIPSTGRFESVAEMSAVTGERNPGWYSQAKVHTKPAIAPDGRVYFGTKSGKPARSAEKQANYPGGHLLVYDPRAGRTTDLGIIKPRVSIICVGFDPQRGLVYALTDPDSHLVVYDPRARTFSDKGQFGPPGESPTRYLVTLPNGDAFHPLGQSLMARYNAAAGTIERLSVVMTGGGTYEPPYALTAAADGRRFFGVGNTSGQVYLYEPRGREMWVRNLGAAVLEGYATPGWHYTMTTAPGGAVYYTGSASPPQSAGMRGEFFILRVGPDEGRPQVVGRVAPLGSAPPGYTRQTTQELIMQGSTVTPDGTLIIMTAYPLRLSVFRGLAAR